MTTTIFAAKGGAWLIEEAPAEGAFTRERLNDEQRMIGRTAEEFLDNEVVPVIDRLEQKDWALARTLVRRGGELGLLATDVPEAYGGLDLDKVSSVVVGEAVGRGASFATTFGAQSGLAITPILCFGTEEQKQSLPAAAGGRRDGRRLRAQRIRIGIGRTGRTGQGHARADGSFLLNGEKMWITNEASPTCSSSSRRSTTRDRALDKARPVQRLHRRTRLPGRQHRKGRAQARPPRSSTTPLIPEQKVPAENLLGEIGKGHKIAFNTLNYGRLKLGAMCSGGARLASGRRPPAAQRKQFGKPIASFGAIKQKLGDTTARELRGRSDASSDRRTDRRHARGGPQPRSDPRGAGGIRDRGVDPQGREQ
jgi:alkylation response protein AidB-like acyl-CoA dehydrogenase